MSEKHEHGSLLEHEADTDDREITARRIAVKPPAQSKSADDDAEDDVEQTAKRPALRSKRRQEDAVLPGTPAPIVDTPLPPAYDDSHQVDISSEQLAESGQFVDLAVMPAPDEDSPSLPVEERAESIDAFISVANVDTPISAAPITPIPETPTIPHSPAQFPLFRFLPIIVSCILLIVITSSALLVQRDLAATDLYAYALDPGSGSIQVQKDLGSYPDNTALTASAYLHSSIFVGVQSMGVQNREQVLIHNSVSWATSGQFSTPLTHSAFSATLDGHLIITGAYGIQVRSADGRLLWQMRGDQPTRGAHRFQPVSDATTLYAVKSVRLSQVAAYDLSTGAVRWTQALDDTIDAMPPLLLDGHTLYIAGDHKVYALNSKNGDLLWEQPLAARTLLAENEGLTHLLILASSQGLVALNPDMGTVVWSFDGQQSNVNVTPAQLYQATMGTVAQRNIIFTTGIVWQVPQVQQQLWLYAVDASSGSLLWSQRIASNFVGVDAGRTFSPLFDPTHATVLLQQQIADDEQHITAFDAGKGTQRWTTTVTGIKSAAPDLLRTPGDALILFAITPRASSAWRLLLIVLSVLSVAGLLLTWMLPLRRGMQRVQHMQRILRSLSGGAHNLLQHARDLAQQCLRLWSLAPRLCALVLLLILAGAGILSYAEWQRPQSGIHQVAAHTGALQWQHAISPSTQIARTDAQGSMIVAELGSNLRQVQALGSDGAVVWKTFSSEGTFSLLPVSFPQGDLLIALSGQTSLTYQFAPPDPAYPDPLAHLLVLYQFNRATGKPVWQSIVNYPGSQSATRVIGADARLIYIASIQANADGSGSTAQLLAVDQASGAIAWRIFGPTEQDNAAYDYGKLLIGGHSVIWQVAGVVYALDTAVGQIEWRHAFVGDAPLVSMQEEGQMIETDSALLISREDGIHGLDLTTGNELWALPTPGPSIDPSPLEIIGAGHIVLVYGHGQIEAFDTMHQRLLWSQKQLTLIQGVRISQDGKTAYAIVLSDAATGPVVTALDMQTGMTRWTFEPSGPSGSVAFIRTQADGFQYRQGLLFVVACLSTYPTSCTDEQLYAIDAATGEALWHVEGASISDIRVSPDGKQILFRISL